MIGEEKLKKLAQYALSVSKADQIEVVLIRNDHNLTRFANNSIHQNTDVENISISVRSIVGKDNNPKKIGVTSANVFDKESIKKIVERSNKIAQFQKEDPYLISLPKPEKPILNINSFSEEVAKLDAENKASKVKKLVDQTKKEKMIASGAFTTGSSEITIANSLGIWAYHPCTEVDFSTVITDKDSSGYAQYIAYNLSEFDISKLASEAIEKAKKSRKPIKIKPGKYDVVLEEYAVGDMLGYLAYLGFGGKNYHENKSFASGKLGQKILGENISITEDALHPENLPFPFDWEGMSRKRVPIVEKGILKNVVYDSYTADKYKKKSSGHALPAPNTLGPLPLNLILHPGKYSKGDMLRSIKKGIWVSRFHYVNAHHFKKLNITGMTRDGTFLVENGRIVSGIFNLRFTQSIPEALSRVEMVGKEVKLVEHIGTHLAPALKIKDFNFTSGT